ncbi:glycosyltransferase family 4 protein [Winogradskyella echinorum]|uniref:Glycosyltransferase family 4 protein n=1 Tax=Winogradskyella echinorum TaxID=538189 RepID=A0ABR6Y4D5_9FLAO|nr:glycosyltransferase family 4 protein [Winogradskyella echinorum]MBC3847100.1 glycosyltransferase family 4 protein [Winogradskyella echinorum]MBC5751448.1 glycosyltransferase family 4 protein [Winogradskyella echinorum]
MKDKLLIIGLVWPEPKSSAAGSRMLQLVEQFQKQGYEITFACAAKTSQNTFNLSHLGIKTQDILLNDASFDAFILALNPNIVLFDRFMTEEQYGWRVAKHCPTALRILDTEDFHGLRKARELALKAGEEVTVEYLQNDTTKREIASIYRCDLSLIISEAEIEILTKQFKIDRDLLYYLPFLLEPINDLEIKEFPSFTERQHFITIGNFLHPPNYDAVLYLKNNIWPLIRKQLPKAELLIYGAYESQKVSQLHNEKQGFLIKGFIQDVNEVMQKAKVCLAPLRFGAGLKGKLVDAMQNGTPCIMSSIAAEGMFGNLKANGFVEDSTEVFAEKSVELYLNTETWISRQEHGFKVLNKRFSKIDFQSDFKSRISELLKDLQYHRQKNFIGNLLQHQTLQSTKYMSKWIEEKNR